MSLVSITEISSLMLAFISEQASLRLTWSETPEDTFSHDEAQFVLYEPRHDKTNKMSVRPAKTQISLGMASAQSDQCLRCPHEESLGP